MQAEPNEGDGRVLTERSPCLAPQRTVERILVRYVGPAVDNTSLAKANALQSLTTEGAILLGAAGATGWLKVHLQGTTQSAQAKITSLQAQGMS